MLTLNDGRSELWQWDTGRTLAVDADCSQVHFSNKVFGRSIDVDVADGVAIIPDILLQTDKDLNVWSFVGTAENGYTKISKTFKVNRRNKPADYVFTPQEQIMLKDAIAIVETAKSAANDAIESAKQAEDSADKADKIAGAAATSAIAASTKADEAADSAREAVASERAAAKAAEIAQDAAESLQPEVKQIKDDLANKLPKSPANWEAWTAEEQAAALDRMGIGGFWGMDLPLLKTITLEEAVSSIDVLSSDEGITLQEFSVFLFATAAGDDGVGFSGILCLRSNGGSQYWGYSEGYIKKTANAYKIWHTKIYDNKFAVTDIIAGFSITSSDIAYGSYQGLSDASRVKYSAVTSIIDSDYAIDNLNLFLSGASASGAVIPRGSMIFLFGR